MESRENHMSILSNELYVQIVALMNFLENQNERNWIRSFKNFLNTLKNNDDLQEVARSIISCYGGMGSFNDLVLVKNQKMLVEENNFLQMLSELIYRICMEIITYQK